MAPTLRIVDAAGLTPWVQGLRALEADISYPIDDGRDRFTIDHGAHYHPFFSSLGDARFLVATEGDAVLGGLVGVFRDAREGERTLPAVYLCDYKVAPAQRGRGTARAMATHALSQAITDRSLWRWKLAYAAAMRGERGDVMRSARGVHAAKLLRPEATLAVYFAKASSLAALDDAHCPSPPASPGLDLSPYAVAGCEGPGVTSTAGRKDLRLASTGASWPLAHLPLGPRDWAPSLGAYLHACGRYVTAASGGDATTCFAVDRRLASQVDWLASQGVSPGATCAVYTLRLAWNAPIPPWVHLATSEI